MKPIKAWALLDSRGELAEWADRAPSEDGGFCVAPTRRKARLWALQRDKLIRVEIREVKK